jgi:hypothetical protein
MTSFKTFGIGIAGILVLAILWTIHSKDIQIDKLNADNFKLNSDLQQITITNGTIKVQWKTKTEIKEIVHYVPVESPNTTITTDNSGNVQMNATYLGQTFTPWLGVTYKDELKPILGARFLYWNRFGLSGFIGNEILGAGIDYRIPYFSNTSIGICYPSVCYVNIFF